LLSQAKRLRAPIGEGGISALVMLFTGHAGPLVITNWVQFRDDDAE
jgi:hypothetical protein